MTTDIIAEPTTGRVIAYEVEITHGHRIWTASADGPIAVAADVAQRYGLTITDRMPRVRRPPDCRVTVHEEVHT
jgi:hypothetical protein